MFKNDFAKLGALTGSAFVLSSPLAKMACTGQMSEAAVYGTTMAISVAVAVVGLAVTHKTEAAPVAEGNAA